MLPAPPTPSPHKTFSSNLIGSARYTVGILLSLLHFLCSHEKNYVPKSVYDTFPRKIWVEYVSRIAITQTTRHSQSKSSATFLGFSHWYDRNTDSWKMIVTLKHWWPVWTIEHRRSSENSKEISSIKTEISHSLTMNLFYRK